MQRANRKRKENEYYADLIVSHWDRHMDNYLFEEVINHKVKVFGGGASSYFNYLHTYLESLPKNSIYKIGELKKYSKLTADEIATIDEFIKIESNYLTGKVVDTFRLKKLSKDVNVALKDTFDLHLINYHLKRIDSLVPNKAKADFIKSYYDSPDIDRNM